MFEASRIVRRVHSETRGRIRSLGLALLLATLATQGASAAQREELVVAYRAGAAAAVRDAVVRLGGSVRFDLAELRAMSIELPSSSRLVLARVPGVERVEADPPRRLQLRRSLRRPVAAPAAATGQVVPYGIGLVQADQVSDAPAGARKLCVIDTGLDGAHEDHAGHPMTGEDLTRGGAGPFVDLNGHGTAVTGVALAIDNAVGVVGVAPNNRLQLHVAKAASPQAFIGGAGSARGMLSCWRHGAHVINMSYGGPTPSLIEQRAIEFLSARGLLLVAAAGNDGTEAKLYPASHPQVVSVAAVDEQKAWADFSQFNDEIELAAPGVALLTTVPTGTGRAAGLTVGATSYGVFSLEGSPVATAAGPLADFGLGDVLLPGAMTGRTCLILRGVIPFSDKVLNCQGSGGVGAVVYNNEPGVVLGGLSGVATAIPSATATAADGAAMLTQLGQQAILSVEVSNVDWFDGTSLASPHVAAVAALVWSHHPQCTAEQMRTTLLRSALDIGDSGYDVKTGHGLVQAKAALDRVAQLGCGQ